MKLNGTFEFIDWDKNYDQVKKFEISTKERWIEGVETKHRQPKTLRWQFEISTKERWTTFFGLWKSSSKGDFCFNKGEGNLFIRYAAVRMQSPQ